MAFSGLTDEEQEYAASLPESGATGKPLPLAWLLGGALVLLVLLIVVVRSS